MAFIPLSDLLTELTVEETEATLISFAGTLGLSVTSWPAGGIGRTIISLMAQGLSMASRVIPVITAGGFRETAGDGWLTNLALSVFNVTRVEAESGTTDITFTNTSGVAYPVVAGDIILAHSSTGKTYTLTQAGTIPAQVILPGPVVVPGTIDLAVIADEPGTGSNAFGGSITVMVTPLIGVTATNANDLIGTDEETDDQLRVRCGDALGALSPDGSKSAYDYIAKSVPLVAVTRTKVIEFTELTAVTFSGAGTSVVTASGVPIGAHDFVVLVTTGGTIGTPGIIIDVSIDGGVSFAFTGVALGTASFYLIGSTSVTVNFGAGTLVASDEATWRAKRNGEVAVLLADADGEVSVPNVATVNTAIQLTVVPAGITAAVDTATSHPLSDFTVNIYIYESANIETPGSFNDASPFTGFASDVVTAISDYLQILPIGGDKLPNDPNGYLFREHLISAVRALNPKISTVSLEILSSPMIEKITLMGSEVVTPESSSTVVNIIEVPDP